MQLLTLHKIEVLSEINSDNEIKDKLASFSEAGLKKFYFPIDYTELEEVSATIRSIRDIKKLHKFAFDFIGSLRLAFFNEELEKTITLSYEISRVQELIIDAFKTGYKQLHDNGFIHHLKAPGDHLNHLLSKIIPYQEDGFEIIVSHGGGYWFLSNFLWVNTMDIV